jgi:transcriptional regulator with XRE-family HTH domain
MKGGDLILMARRRAGLTQRELAERVACRQATVARWERGDRQASYEDVQGVAEACGLQVEAHLALEDRSWWPQIAVQLGCEPIERVRRLTPPEAFDVVPVLEALADTAVPAIVLGEVAGALHGWPLVLGTGTVEVCARAEDALSVALDGLGAGKRKGGAYELPGGGRLLVTALPPGTTGFGDLARDAGMVEIGGGGVRVLGGVRVADLRDLLRITDASPDPDSRRQALAYRAVLDVQRARRETRPEEKASDEERVRAWLSRQTPVA